MGSGSAVSGRFSRASARTTRLRRASARRLRRCLRRSRRRPVPAASFPSRCGTARRSRKGELAPGQADRLGDAPRLGACGICEASAFARRRQGVRHAPARRAPLPRKETDRPLPPLARGLPDGEAFSPGRCCRLDLPDESIVRYTPRRLDDRGRHRDAATPALALHVAELPTAKWRRAASLSSPGGERPTKSGADGISRRGSSRREPRRQLTDPCQ